jgi:hypothetical protein
MYFVNYKQSLINFNDYKLRYYCTMMILGAKFNSIFYFKNCLKIHLLLYLLVVTFLKTYLSLNILYSIYISMEGISLLNYIKTLQLRCLLVGLQITKILKN